ncbi:hypothetical protein EPN52_05795, partial [bacterium]
RGPAPERFGLARRTGRWSGFLHRTPSLRFRGVQSPRGSLHYGHTFVPLRFVAQALGATVVYLAATRAVTIHQAAASDASGSVASTAVTPYPEQPPYAPTPVVPPLPSPTPYPDYSRSGIYPFLPQYAQAGNGLFFGVASIPNGWGYFTIPGMPGEYPLLPWPGVPGRYYGVASIPLIAAAPQLRISGRFYGPGGTSQPFALAVPLGNGAAAPLIFAIPAPAPASTPTPAATPTPTPAPARTAAPEKRHRPIVSRRPAATPTPALKAKSRLTATPQ